MKITVFLEKLLYFLHKLLMEYTDKSIDIDILKYFSDEGLTKYIPCHPNSDLKYRYQAGFEINPNLAIEFPPDIIDLVRMHKLVRQRKCLTIMEFGVGYSTLILADAMMKNQEDLKTMNTCHLVWSNQFEVHSIDSSKKWIKNFKKKLKKFPHLIKFINLHYSELRTCTIRGEMGHVYERLPDIVPDFIYLDGPCPADVHGEVQGFTFKQLNRTVMAMDILKMEAALSPGTFILVDGRSNNARFLKNHFSRKWVYSHAIQNVWPLNNGNNIQFEDWNEYDYTTFELIEFPLSFWNFKKLQLQLPNNRFQMYLNYHEEDIEIKKRMKKIMGIDENNDVVKTI
jgi:hypothetical protein